MAATPYGDHTHRDIGCNGNGRRSVKIQGSAFSALSKQNGLSVLVILRL